MQLRKMWVVAALCAAVATGCSRVKVPVRPTPVDQPEQSSDAGRTPGPATTYPSTGSDIIAYVAARYPERLAGGISLDQRVENMQFLRDRIIEAGKCGGLDLGWNMKRGGPEKSNDFLAWRRSDGDMGVDIGFNYDNATEPLRLQWLEAGLGASYAEYPTPSCP
jgi:hypothetical protein